MTLERTGRGRGRFWAGLMVGTVLCCLLLLAAAAAVVTWLGVGAYEEHRADTGTEPATVTAVVEEGSLAQTVPVTVTFRPGTEQPVPGPVLPDGRAAVVSRSLPEAGDEVSEGQVLAEVGLRPVFVLEGSVPMVRQLTLGLQGEDVVQLQQALGRLGYDVTDDGTLGRSSMAAVQKLYADAGYALLTADGHEARSMTAAEDLVVPMGELAFVPTLPARIDSCGALGSTVEEGPVCSLLVGDPQVFAMLTDRQAEGTNDGDLVRVTVGGRELELVVDGEPRQVDVTSEDTAEEGAPGFNAEDQVADVRLNLRGAEDDTADGTGAGTLVVERTVADGLLVPATALRDGTGGTTVLVVGPGGDSAPEEVSVGVGLCVAGTCLVTPTVGEMDAGDRVLVQDAGADG